MFQTVGDSTLSKFNLLLHANKLNKFLVNLEILKEECYLLV